jgi:hypothetical protein
MNGSVISLFDWAILMRQKGISGCRIAYLLDKLFVPIDGILIVLADFLVSGVQDLDIGLAILLSE